MVSSRIPTAAVGFLISLAVSVAAYVHFETLLFFLFVPFVPFLFRRGDERGSVPDHRECPACGWRTREEAYDYCPRDGTRLESQAAGQRE